MKKFLKGLATVISALFIISFGVFAIKSIGSYKMPYKILGEDASEEDVKNLRQELGLDDPLIIRYVRYLKNIVAGDLGTFY